MSEDRYSDSSDYYSEENKLRYTNKTEKDSEIHMSLCLSAFSELQPQKYSEMRQIFEQWKVPYEKMCSMPDEIICDPELVVQIENNFYPW